MKKIRTECSVEIDDVFVVKRLGRSVEGWCAGCGGTATMVTPEDAATLVGTGARSIYRLVESGEIHWAEGPETLVLICLCSLLERAGQDFHTE
ncbi:MAG: helix-turn-helix domain-containing protein [Acidobacteria bacterium]|nr:helix-turn-helix domain-containing protein [Acidobacteriota bacterium]